MRRVCAPVVGFLALALAVTACGGGDDGGGPDAGPDAPDPDTSAPTVDITAPADGAFVEGDVVIEASASDDRGVVRVEFYVDGVLAGSDDAAPYQYTWATAMAAIGNHGLSARAYDAAGNVGTDDDTTVVSGLPPPPPDPSTVAPDVDPTRPTTVFDATGFLYTGPDPIQTGVAPGTIDPRAAALIRGRVTDRAGAPLASATVRVHGHPELGQTLTRVDGRFDLVVNGGGRMTIDYQRPGYLPAQRSLEVPWQRYLHAPDVALVALDSQVTQVDLATAADWTVARAGQVSDGDGTRTARVLFPPGLTAEVELPDGSTQPLTSLAVRATEYTVGDGGLAAMPGELPPTSGYTYAVEVSVDEAMAAGGKRVRFSGVVPFYVDDFLGFGAGTVVPAGYYDRDATAWQAGDNGLVIEVLSMTGGLADLDLDGSGTAADAAALAAAGITDAERAVLAGEYPPGAVLWRVPMTHFTPWDCNWPAGPPGDAVEPGDPELQTDPDEDQHRCWPGSAIDAQEQTVGESVGVPGTPYRLHYRSNRAPGRRARRRLTVRVTGSTVPASLDRVELAITIAGQERTVTLPATADQTYAFDWDGLDAYGRPLEGSQAVGVEVGYVYPATYYEPSELDGAFARISDTATITGDRTRGEITLSRSATTRLGDLDPRSGGLGGWTLTVHHAYDPQNRILFRGDGAVVRADALEPQITVAAGDGYQGNTGDGGPATQARVGAPRRLAVAPDGTVYFTDARWCVVRRIDPDGIIDRVAGIPCDGSSRPPRSTTDGGLALDAVFSSVEGIALDSQGRLFVADDNVLWRIDPDDHIRLVTGDIDVWYSSGVDGAAASTGTFGAIYDVTVGPDDSLYFPDYWGANVRRIDAAGRLTKVAGTMTAEDDPYPPDGYDFPAQEGQPATTGHFDWPLAVDVDRDGRIYVGDISCLIRRINPDGKFETIAGVPPSYNCAYVNDPQPAAGGAIVDPYGYEFGPDGEVYYVDLYASCIRVRTSDGIMRRVAGRCGQWRLTRDMVGIPGPASAAYLNAPWDVALGPGGELYIADVQSVIWKVTPAMPGLGTTDVLVASEDGTELYRFDGAGRHLSTLHALTGQVLSSFTYDGAGLLTTVTDGSGNPTTIARAADGTPTSITSPDGLVTSLTVDGDGYLATITNPAGEVATATYTTGGLLATFTDAAGNLSTMSYDPASGRLISDASDDGTWSLTRSSVTDGYQVAVATGGGLTRTSAVRRPFDGNRIMDDTDGAGLTTSASRQPDGTDVTTRPTGSLLTTHRTGDDRFAMQTPLLADATLSMPSGLTLSATRSRTVTLATPGDPLSLTSQVDTTTIGTRVYTTAYDQATRTLTTTTPVGRQTAATIDGLGRITRLVEPGIDPVDFTYTSQGRPSRRVTGTGAAQRVASFTYTSEGFFESHLDPEGRLFQVTAHDLIGRPRELTLPGGRTIGLSYDPRGLVDGVTAPSGASHLLARDATGRVVAYTAPDAGGGPAVTSYTYDADHHLTRIDVPGGQAVTLGHDAGGRLATVDLGTRTITTTYHPTTGNIASHSGGGQGLAYTYDGELLTGETWSGAVTGTVARAYDTSFRLTTLTVRTRAFGYGYDNDGLMTQAGQLALTRDPTSGAVTATSLGTVTTTTTRDGFGEVTAQSASAGATPLWSTTYTRDKLGRVTRRTDSLMGGPAVATDYSYAAEGWLAGVTVDSVATEQYGYDADGNRTSVTNGAGTAAATADAQDRLTGQGTATFAYTADGRLLTRTDGAAVTSYVHDLLGNLTRVTLPTGTVIDYTIDPLGRRVARAVDGTPDQGFLYANNLLPVAELDGGGAVVSYFVYRAGWHVPEYLVRGGATYRILADPLGSPRLVVNASTGAVAQALTYDGYGRITSDSNPGFQPFGFAGGLYDPLTGLTRMGARDYDAALGRFTAKDPIGFAGGDINLYAFAGGDPVNGIDPLGTAGSAPQGVYDPTGNYAWPNLPSPTSPPPSSATNNLPTRAAAGAGTGTGLFQEQGPLLDWLNRTFPSTTNIAAYCHEAIYPRTGPFAAGNGLATQPIVTVPILVVGAPIEAVARGAAGLWNLVTGGGGGK